MKTLSNFVKESLDVDNIIWKINTWFYNKPDEKNEFDKLCQSFKGVQANRNSVEEILQGNTKNVKPFIDFLDDTVINTESKDYLYLLSKVVNTINANKNYE